MTCTHASRPPCFSADIGVVQRCTGVDPHHHGHLDSFAVLHIHVCHQVNLKDGLFIFTPILYLVDLHNTFCVPLLPQLGACVHLTFCTSETLPILNTQFLSCSGITSSTSAWKAPRHSGYAWQVTEPHNMSMQMTYIICNNIFTYTC